MTPFIDPRIEYLISFLSSIHPLSEECKSRLRSIIKEKNLKKGDIILRPGVVHREMSFVMKGLVWAYYTQEEGGEVTAWFMSEGDVITDVSSFYRQKPSYKFIVMLEDTDLFYITYDELRALYRDFMEFNFVRGELVEKYLEMWDSRQNALIKRSARGRYEWFLEQYANIALRVPAKRIADFLGITEVTLSKVKKELATGSRHQQSKTPELNGAEKK